MNSPSETAAARLKGGSYCIMRDHEDPKLIAVYRVAAGRPVERVATGFASREEAERWIHYHRGQGGEP